MPRNFKKALDRLAHFTRDQSGATAMEYSIIVAMISTAMVVGLAASGITIKEIAELIALAIASGVR
ncbi:MAG: Flp family type IVb pilin [Pseudomonadota bacterium]